MPELTLLIPAYNEAQCIEASVKSCIAHCLEAGLDFEVLVVDDGSTDETAAIVESLCQDHAAGFERLRLLRLKRNVGKGGAVRAGLAVAAGRYVIFTDADLSTPMEEVPKILPALQDSCDVVLGTRHAPGSSIPVPQPPLRRLAGRAYRQLARMVLRSQVSDLQCGTKGFKVPVARTIARQARLEGYAFDAEIVILARQHGWRVGEVPIVWRHRGGSKVSLLRDAPKMFIDLLKVRVAELRGGYRPGDSEHGSS
ncbi:MAG: glycosyltransferase family 2 protein [Phycisphaerales bacterium]|nr:glycosyltransferase family 2 protein [Phycisphaerales bacterium]